MITLSVEALSAVGIFMLALIAWLVQMTADLKTIKQIAKLVKEHEGDLKDHHDRISKLEFAAGEK